MTSNPPPRTAIVLHDADDVAVATDDLEEGDTVTILGGAQVSTVVVRERIPIGHKISLRPIEAGTEVRKYGEVIGRLTGNAEQGAHVHVHNLKSLRAKTDASLPQPTAAGQQPDPDTTPEQGGHT
jgi:altronate dehydratase small subunit